MDAPPRPRRSGGHSEAVIRSKRFFYVCGGSFLLALVCGCGTEGGGPGLHPVPQSDDVWGRVHLRAALRAPDATFQGYRVITDADGVPVDLTRSALVASTQTAGGVYRFPDATNPFVFDDYLVRTVVAAALADSAVAISGTQAIVTTLELFSDEATQVVPNPFDGQTDIRVEVPTAGRVVVEVRSLSGGLVRGLVDTTLPSGSRAIRWDSTSDAGGQVPYGLYWIVTTQGGIQHAELAIRSPP